MLEQLRRATEVYFNRTLNDGWAFYSQVYNVNKTYNPDSGDFTESVEILGVNVRTLPSYFSARERVDLPIENKDIRLSMFFTDLDDPYSVDVGTIIDGNGQKFETVMVLDRNQIIVDVHARPLND